MKRFLHKQNQEIKAELQKLVESKGFSLELWEFATDDMKALMERES